MNKDNEDFLMDKEDKDKLLSDLHKHKDNLIDIKYIFNMFIEYAYDYNYESRSKFLDIRYKLTKEFIEDDLIQYDIIHYIYGEPFGELIEYLTDKLYRVDINSYWRLSSNFSIKFNTLAYNRIKKIVNKLYKNKKLYNKYQI